MQGKGVDPGSPTQAENGQAGAFLGTRQPVPPSTPSSGSQGRQMPQESPGLGAKGGNVSGLGKGCGGNGSFPMQFQQGIASGAYGMAPNVCSVQPDFAVNQQGFSACRPNFCGNQQQNNVFEQQNGMSGQLNAGFCQGNVSFGTQNPGCFGNQRSEMFGNFVNEENQGFRIPPGMNVGGCTPQAQRMQQVMSLSQGLSGAQLVTLVQSLQDQMRQQTRFTPEVFGQIPFNLGSSNGGIAPLDSGRDGSHNEASHSTYVDVFSKSEKWIGAPPKPNFESWGNRESEVRMGSSGVNRIFIGDRTKCQVAHCHLVGRPQSSS